jgi:hypothetical protein
MQVAKRGYRKMTPEERARQIQNEERLERLLQRRLDRDGTTLEAIHRRLGLPPPPAREA